MQASELLLRLGSVRFAVDAGYVADEIKEAGSPNRLIDHNRSIDRLARAKFKLAKTSAIGRVPTTTNPAPTASLFAGFAAALILFWGAGQVKS